MTYSLEELRVAARNIGDPSIHDKFICAIHTIENLKQQYNKEVAENELTRRDKIAIEAMKGIFASEGMAKANIGERSLKIADIIMGEKE